jgi:hypothetical protein
MAKKTGNKWSTDKCGYCGEAHYRYSGKLDAQGIEYVICGQTHKRMNVSGEDYRTRRTIISNKTQLFATVWVKEQRYVDYVSEHLAVLGEHDHQLFKQLWNGLVIQGWRLDSESKTSVRLSKDGVAIKVFRNADRPEMIMVRFTAPLEEE